MKVLADPHYVLDPDGLPSVTGAIKYGELIEGVDVYRYDTVDRSRTNLKLAAREMHVYDIKSRKDLLSYHTDGFTLYNHSSQCATLANSEMIGTDEFLAELRKNYEAEMAQFLREVTGTPYVFPQPVGFFVRHGAKSKLKTPQRPAALPHKDFTLQTANEMSELMQNKFAPGKQFKRFAIYQSWRAVSPPPQDSYLCFCGPRTVADADFRIVESIMGPEDVPGNVYKMEMALYNPAHEWFYFSNLTAENVIIFQGFDPISPVPILHTSFDNPEPGASPRVSIECRHYAFFE
jgi:hypothetical protein